ncbi:MAG: ABC transporter ATP-binding protein [Acidocella sp.]|uniref:ABC transporter ATP-binding protein n=1 Tax=Acidocella sp. TaxID=50710 RepID=UPI003FC65972
MSGAAFGGGHAGVGGEVDEDIYAPFNSSVLKRVAAFVAPYKAGFFVALSAVMCFVAAQLAIPYVIRAAVNAAVHKPGALPINTVGVIFLAVIGFNAAASYSQEVLSARLAQRVIFDMRRAMFAHLQDVSLSFLDKTHVGRIMSRLQGDVNALQEFFETSIQATGDLVLLVGIIAVLLVMEWRLALVTLTVLPVMIFIRALWLPQAKIKFRRARDASSIVNGALAENIAGVRVVQGARRERVNLADFAQKANNNLEAQVAVSWTSQIMVPTVDVLTGLAMAAIVLIGGQFVLKGTMDLGIMVAFIFYVQRFFDPIRTVSQQYTMMQRATAASHRILEVIDVPLQIEDKPGAQPLEAKEFSIEFDHVKFGYKPGQIVLKDLSFTVPANSTVALVGPTGSGKTSVSALIHRFYDVNEGQVHIGGQDVRDVTLASLGRHIAIVLQEPFLFTGTILENIRYSSHWASREDIIEAAKATQAHEFISRLPLGYDTLLEQRGQNLSIGQRQLLSFARALVADPHILILDEATASIDSFVEAQIQQALRVLLEGRTSIVIAHRLATVRDADNIIVLRSGEILEQGNHEQLLAAGGLYAMLYRKNFSSFDEAAE